MGSLSKYAEIRTTKLEKLVIEMLEGVISSSLTPIQSSFHALSLSVISYVTKQKRPSEKVSLQPNVCKFADRSRISELVDFDALMRTVADKDAPEEAETADIDVETDDYRETTREEFTPTQEENHIFGNLSHPRRTVMKHLIHTS